MRGHHARVARMELSAPPASRELALDLVDSLGDDEHRARRRFGEEVAKRAVEAAREQYALAVLRGERERAAEREHVVRPVAAEECARVGDARGPEPLRFRRHEIDDLGDWIAHMRPNIPRAASDGASSTSCAGPSSTMRPSASTATRSAAARAKSTSCVATSERAPAGRQRAKRCRERAAARRVERRRGLVHQQHDWIERQHARDRDALRFAAGQLPRQRVRAMRHAKRLEKLTRRPLRIGARDQRERVDGRERDVVERREMLEQRVRLKYHSHPAAQRVEAATPAARAPGASATSPTATLPASNACSAATARSTVDLPAPEVPMSAQTSPARRRGRRRAASRGPPRCEAQVAHAQRRVVLGRLRRRHATIQRRSSRRANRDSGSENSRYDERAQHAGDDPAADVRRVDRRLLGELDDGDHRDERRILEQRDEVVRHRRQREAQRLRPAHEAKDLKLREPERARRLELRCARSPRARRDRSPIRTPRS